MVKTANRTKEVLEATQNGQELTLVPTKPMRAGIADVFDAAQMVQATSADNFPDDAIARLGLQSMCKSAAAKQMDEMPADGVNPRYYYCHVVQINKQNYQGVNTAIRTVIVTGTIMYGLARRSKLLKTFIQLLPYSARTKLLMVASSSLNRSNPALGRFISLFSQLSK